MITGMKKNLYTQNANTPPVTIVIAAHNEKDTISACLASLYKQDYPHKLISIIVADDRSSDGTAESIAKLADSSISLTVVRIDTCPQGISPKKNALSKALALVKDDIVLQTDADCILPDGWVRGMVSHFNADTGMLVGVAPYRQQPGWINSFVRHEYLWNCALASGTIAYGRGTHASGRNMGFRMRAFREAGGYGDGIKVLSGDDTLLLHGIRHHTDYKVVSAVSPHTHVYTDSPPTLKALLRQRLRHMSTGKYFDMLHLLLGTGIYGFHIIIISMILLSSIEPLLLIPLGVELTVKLLADLYAAKNVQNISGLQPEWRRFILNEIILFVYMAIIPVMGTLFSVEWKEIP